jgi:hypothetical protein
MANSKKLLISRTQRVANRLSKLHCESLECRAMLSQLELLPQFHFPTVIEPLNVSRNGRSLLGKADAGGYRFESGQSVSSFPHDAGFELPMKLADDGRHVVGPKRRNQDANDILIWDGNVRILANPDDPGDHWYEVDDVSYDASVIVGQGLYFGTQPFNYRWSETNGFESIQRLKPIAVSDDGTRIAGMSDSVPAVWSTSTGITNLGGPSTSTVTAMSGDGSTIVGEWWRGELGLPVQGIVWRNGTSVELPIDPRWGANINAQIVEVTTDGGLVVGNMWSGNDTYFGVIWPTHSTVCSAFNELRAAGVRLTDYLYQGDLYDVVDIFSISDVSGDGRVFTGVAAMGIQESIYTLAPFRVELPRESLCAPASDLRADSLESNGTAVSLRYSILNRTLADNLQARFYWASGPNDSDRMGGPIRSKSLATAVGSHNLGIPIEELGLPPPNATHIIAIVDALNQVAEASERNNTIALRIRSEPDIRVANVRSLDFRQFEITYLVSGSEVSEFDIRAFISTDDSFDEGVDMPLAPEQPLRISAASDRQPNLDGTAKTYTKTLTLSNPAPITPTHRYVIIVADPEGGVTESDEGNNSVAVEVTCNDVVRGALSTPVVKAATDGRDYIENEFTPNFGITLGEATLTIGKDSNYQQAGKRKPTESRSNSREQHNLALTFSTRL